MTRRPFLASLLALIPLPRKRRRGPVRVCFEREVCNEIRRAFDEMVESDNCDPGFVTVTLNRKTANQLWAAVALAARGGDGRA